MKSVRESLDRIKTLLLLLILFKVIIIVLLVVRIIRS